MVHHENVCFYRRNMGDKHKDYIGKRGVNDHLGLKLNSVVSKTML